MSEFNRSESYIRESEGSLNAYIAKVFTIMGAGLGITTVIAYLSYLSFMSGGFVYRMLVTTSPIVFFALFFVEIGIAIAMGRGITRFSTGTCRLLFFVYSAITGITFGILPIGYGVDTLFVAFLFAAVLFACCAIIGYTTNIDLTRFQGLLFAGLITVVVLSVLSMFVPVLRDSLLIGYLGLVVFLGLTAYDMQKIKYFYYNGVEGTVKENLAVYAAFELYLDFINIFLYILRILGSRNRN